MKGTMEAHPVWPVLLLATSNCSYALSSFVHTRLKTACSSAAGSRCAVIVLASG